MPLPTSLLHVPDTDTLAEQCGNYYRCSYLNNEIGFRKIANSLWMDYDTSWNPEFIENAAENFYAPVFSMDLESKETAKAMSAWISEQTNGSLAPELSAGGESVLTLINTVAFHDEWVDRFNKDKTKPDSFYLSGGSSVTCDFMNQTFGSHGFTVGEGYTRSCLSLKNNTMIFILPDEGISPQSLIATSEKMQEAFLSGVIQGTHIAVNEDGVDASAFTLLEYAGAAMPDGRADMIMNRPFLYGIIGTNGALLFVGICGNPTLN